MHPRPPASPSVPFRALLRSVSLAGLSLAGLATGSVAQEPPRPAPELQQLAPFIGHWQGSGTAQMGAPEPTRWESQHGFSWALGGFFVQEDTVVRFSGLPRPLVMRVYLGWDAENGRYVSVSADNDGHVRLDRVEFSADGALVQMATNRMRGESYVERSTSRVSGDAMTFTIDMLMAQGPSTQGVTGTMRRVDRPAPFPLDAGSFSLEANPALRQLGRSAGTYDVQATMRMAPGLPELKITGTDRVSALFDGTVVHVHSSGRAEGMPDDYVAELFYGWDDVAQSVRAVLVSNMGEVGEMLGSFTPDNGRFVLVSAARSMGQLATQHMVLTLAADGAPLRAVGTTSLGAAEPYRSWDATYARQDD